ncbi:MAG: HAD family hydrolase [Actinomycetota bacterium]|nr:HAD family hydrolase [Actinomycetota bacterium]
MLALLDLDGTLVDRAAGFQVWAQALVKDHALGDEALAWLTATDLAVKERDRFFALLGERFPVVGDTAALWDDYRARMPHLAPVFPGVLDALIRLRQQGWRLGVVTNGRVDNQLGKLRRSGVLDLLDGWCVSEETGIRKPDPRVFLLARARCGVPAEDLCWVVGDDPDLDVAGGQASGMPTVWVSHGRVWASTARPPDRTGSTPVQALNHLDVDRPLTGRGQSP